MEETFSYKKALITLLIVGLIIGIFYGITILVLENKKNKETTNDTYEANIQYEEIIVSRIYKQNKQEYYVLATTSSDNDSATYISALKNYAMGENSIPTYTIDLDNGFNKKYLVSESNFEGELPYFKTSTLIKVVDGNLSEVYESSDISTALNN